MIPEDLSIPEFLRIKNRRGTGMIHRATAAPQPIVPWPSPSERYAREHLPPAEAEAVIARDRADRERYTEQRSSRQEAQKRLQVARARDPRNKKLPGSRWDTTLCRWVHPALEKIKAQKTGETTMAKTRKKAAPAEKKGRQISRAAGLVEDFAAVRAGTVRAQIIKLATEHSRTIDKIAELAETDRKTVLTHLFCMNRDCAIGYAVDDTDVVTLKFPGSKTAEDAVKAPAEKKAA